MKTHSIMEKTMTKHTQTRI